MISGDAPNGATGSYDGGTAGGSANALTATVSGLGSSPSTGNVVILKTSAANTGAATLAINSGSAIAIKNQDGTTALAGGEMASAKYYLLEYNGTNWVLLNPVVSATDSTKIPLSTVDAKGDLLLGTANDTVGRQAVGANDTFLCADSGQSTGVQWRVLAPSDLPTSLYMAVAISGQTILNGNIDALLCGTPSANTIGLTYSSGTWTATVAGWYLWRYNAGSSDAVACIMYGYKNGSQYDQNSNTTTNTTPGLTTLVYLGVGDTFTPRLYVAGADSVVSAGSGPKGQVCAFYLGK